MQIDTDRPWLETGKEFSNIKPWIIHHSQGKINDSHLKTTRFKVVGHGQKTEGVHFEDGRGRDQVADGPVHDGFASEVIDARWMQQKQINDRHVTLGFQFSRSLPDK